MSTDSPRRGDLWVMNFWAPTDVFVQNVGATHATFLEPALFLSQGTDPDPLRVITRRGLTLVKRSNFMSTARLLARKFDPFALLDEHRFVLSWLRKGERWGNIYPCVNQLPLWDRPVEDILWDLCVFGLVHHHPSLKVIDDFWVDDPFVFHLTDLGRKVSSDSFCQEA